MTEVIQMVSDVGAATLVVAAAYVLGKTFLAEKKEDKENYRADLAAKEAAYNATILKQQEMFKEELAESRDMYKQELAKDRELYVQSIQVVYGEIDTIKTDVSELKQLIKGE